MEETPAATAPEVPEIPVAVKNVMAFAPVDEPTEKPQSAFERLTALSAIVPSLMVPEVPGDVRVLVCGAQGSENRVYRFQLSFMGQEELLRFLGAQSSEEADEMVQLRAASDMIQQTALVMGTVKAALLRHHAEASDDELSDLLALLDIQELGQIFEILGLHFSQHDGLGDYYAGRDPLVHIGEKTYALRWTMAEANDVMRQARPDERSDWKWWRKVLLRALKRWQPNGVSTEELDDIAWKLGHEGIRRLAAGSQRKKDADPNGAGPAKTGPKSGTGTPSS